MKRLLGCRLFLTAIAAVALLFARLSSRPAGSSSSSTSSSCCVGGIALVDVVHPARDAYPLEDVPDDRAALERATRPSRSGRPSSTGSSAS